MNGQKQGAGNVAPLIRAQIIAALMGHQLNTMSQDSGKHCACGSDSRFEQREGDHPWTSIDEHRADMVMRVLPPTEPGGER